MGIPNSGVCYVKSGPRGSGDVRSPPPEHHRSIYRDSYGIGDEYGGREADSRTGYMEMPETERHRLE